MPDDEMLEVDGDQGEEDTDDEELEDDDLVLPETGEEEDEAF